MNSALTTLTVQVSEAAPRHTSVATVSARDPEDSPVSFFSAYMLKTVLSSYN